MKNAPMVGVDYFYMPMWLFIIDGPQYKNEVKMMVLTPRPKK